MENLEFSVPYNNDPAVLNEIFKLKRLGNNRIREIYLSGPREYSGSGRIMPEMKINDLADVVDRIHKEGIRVNLILNPTCEGVGWYSQQAMGKTIEYLRQMHEERGVEAVTITNPLYIWEVRRHFPKIEICASVLGDIDCVQRAVIYNMAKPNAITPDVNINRNLELLKEIKEATNVELKLLVNEGCLYKCPFRKFHFNLSSHLSKETNMGFGVDLSFAKFFSFCSSVIADDHSQILKSCWIRPEDTRKYIEITKYFKIVDRNQPTSMIVRAIKAYLQESWDGDLLDIVSGGLKRFSLSSRAYLDNKSLTQYGFLNKVTSCSYNCKNCNYCQDLAKKLIRFGVPTRGKLEDMGLSEVADQLEYEGKLPRSS